MKLSMAILRAHFVQNNLNCVSDIMKGDMVLEGVRAGASREDGSYACILPGEAAGKPGGALISCPPDSLWLPDTPPEEAFNRVSSVFERCGAWERDMYMTLAQGGTLQQILDIAHPVFARPIFIKSSSGRIKAISFGYPKSVHPLWEKFEESARTDTLEAESTEFVSSDPEYSAVFSQRHPVVVKSPLYGGMVLRSNIWQGDQWVYEIVTFANGKPFNTSDIHFMSVLSAVVDCYAQANKDSIQSFSSVAGFFSRLLKTGECGSTSLLLIGNALGWRPTDELAVVSVSGAAGQDTPALGMLREKLNQELRHAVAVQTGGRLECVVDTELYGGYRGTLERLDALIPPDVFTWGVSYEFVGIERVPRYAPQARRARDEAREAGKRRLTMYDIACRLIGEKLRDGSHDFTGLVHPGVIKLIEKDNGGHSKYAATLFEYLLCGGNYTDTALSLGIHRNSLIYRIGRIQELIGSDLSSPADRKLLLYSFILLGY